jgi:hypothetical protein
MNLIKQYLGYVVAVALLMVGVTGFALGYALADSRGDAAISSLNEDHATALQIASEAARRKESEIRGELYALEQEYTKLEEEAQRAKAEDARLITDLRAGTRRMSIAVKSCGTGAVPGGTATDNELDPAVTESLLAITRDGDQYIKERNACVEQYEIVRRQMNSGAGR